MSFILENDLSQPATEMDTVSRICSSTLKLGNTSFPSIDTINFRIPTGVKSSAACLFSQFSLVFDNLEFLPQDDHHRYHLGMLPQNLHIYSANRQSTGISSHESFSIQQETKRFMQIIELFKPSIQYLDAVTTAFRSDLITLFVSSTAVRLASAAISPGIFFLFLL